MFVLLHFVCGDAEKKDVEKFCSLCCKALVTLHAMRRDFCRHFDLLSRLVRYAQLEKEISIS